MINVFKPSLGEEELNGLREIFETGWIGLGPKTAEFEKRFAKYVDAKYAFAVNSATSALHLACILCDVNEGDEVLVPTNTFVSTALAPMYCGATPVFVDVNIYDLNISVDDLWSKISSRTKAIIPVHYGGYPCDMNEIWKIAKDENIHVIEDAAHACGAEYRGKKVGGLDSDATTFSFHAVKNLATGDGGMITTNNDSFAEKLPKLRWCGIDKSTWNRAEGKEYNWQYDISELGYKYHMNDIIATIGLAQLDKVEVMNDRRRKIVQMYNDAFTGHHEIFTPHEPKYVKSAMHNYVIQTDRRDELHRFLKERKISTGVHYYPIHMQPLFRGGNHYCPNAEMLWTKILTLPLYPSMTDNNVLEVIEAMGEFFGW